MFQPSNGDEQQFSWIDDLSLTELCDLYEAVGEVMDKRGESISLTDEEMSHLGPICNSSPPPLPQPSDERMAETMAGLMAEVTYVHQNAAEAA